MHATPEHERLLKLFGSEVRRFRQACHYSREKFAERLECSARHLQDIEEGTTTPSALFPFYLMALMNDHPRHEFLDKLLAAMRQQLAPRVIHREDTSLGYEPLSV